MNSRQTPRLFVANDLSPGRAVIPDPAQTHYLGHVMRLKAGDAVHLFNGRDGEWRGEIDVPAPGKGSKRAVAEIRIIPRAQLREQPPAPDLWLCAAPIRKAHFDYMTEKATELGVSEIHPVLTVRTQVREVNGERLRAIAIEAAEQSERLDIPVIHEPVRLEQLTANWLPDRRLVVCAEWGDAMPAHAAFASLAQNSRKAGDAVKAAILTGPEGGFSEDEFDFLQKVKNALFIRLGPRILRADTAAIAALSLWQAIKGDWSMDSGIRRPGS